MEVEPGDTVASVRVYTSAPEPTELVRFSRLAEDADTVLVQFFDATGKESAQLRVGPRGASLSGEADLAAVAFIDALAQIRAFGG